MYRRSRNRDDKNKIYRLRIDESALQCTRCSQPFSNLPPSAFVDNGIEQFTSDPSDLGGFAQHRPAYSPAVSASDGDIGRKTFFRYRVYCGAVMLKYLAIAFLGLALFLLEPDAKDESAYR